MAQVKNNPILLDNATKLFGVRDNVPGEVVPGFLGVHNLLHVQDRKAAGTHGGGFTSGAWRTRDLNTVVINNIFGSSLLANIITLPAGDYLVSGLSSSTRVDQSILSLYNKTSSNRPVVGPAVYSGTAGYYSTSIAPISGFLSFDIESEFELQHVCSVTQSAFGLGMGLDLGQPYEIFSDLKIWKIS